MVNVQDKKEIPASGSSEDVEMLLDAPIELRPVTEFNQLEEEHHKDECVDIKSDGLPSQSSVEEADSTANQLHSTLSTSMPVMTSATIQFSDDNFIHESDDDKKAATQQDKDSIYTQGIRANQPKDKLWLLVSKGIWYIVGCILVVVAGIVSHFQHNSSLSSNCTNAAAGNYTL